MSKYLPLLIPVLFYILVGITVFHFSQPAWLLTLILCPRIEIAYVVDRKVDEYTAETEVYNKYNDKVDKY